MIPFRLVVKNLVKHPLRSALTVLSLMVAVFLLSTLRTFVVSLNAGVEQAKTNRLMVQSAVSLFVYLPDTYKAKLREVEGVEEIVRWNWFGGYYQDESNFFGQFGTDPAALLEVYDEIEVIEGSAEDFVGQRTACMIGQATAKKFGFEIGQTIPLVGVLFRRTDGQPWGFKLAAIYRATQKTMDDQTMFFHADYMRESLDQGEATGPSGVSVYVLKTAPGADTTEIMRSVDELYENGPQAVQTTTEAEFNAQFATMVGNIPLFVNAIGLGVFASILLAALNTMLMAAREQTRDVGVLKALGFTDFAVFVVMLSQSLFLCALGGALGIGVAILMDPFVATVVSMMLPTYSVTFDTLALGGVMALGVGFVAGIAPAWRARNLKVVDALSAVA